MALRLARPKTGGLRVKARRMGVLHYATYAAAACPKPAASSLPWVSYDETMAELPQARWIDTAIKRTGGRAAQLRVNDIEAAIEAVAAGYGRSMLPSTIADRDDRLARTPRGSEPKDPTRELWLLVHSDLSGLPRTQAVAEWIEGATAKEARAGRRKPAQAASAVGIAARAKIFRPVSGRGHPPQSALFARPAMRKIACGDQNEPKATKLV